MGCYESLAREVFEKYCDGLRGCDSGFNNVFENERFVGRLDFGDGVYGGGLDETVDRSVLSNGVV